MVVSAVCAWFACAFAGVQTLDYEFETSAEAWLYKYVEPIDDKQFSDYSYNVLEWIRRHTTDSSLYDVLLFSFVIVSGLVLPIVALRLPPSTLHDKIVMCIRPLAAVAAPLLILRIRSSSSLALLRTSTNQCSCFQDARRRRAQYLGVHRLLTTNTTTLLRGSQSIQTVLMNRVCPVLVLYVRA